ncbi:MAG: SDR family oxidoreductase [Leptospiraceae bacterium]|nr:SDR family oxidoreductase [Leptospiraceae bacterium]MCP5510814.1 SDR family oxidoreductase [Leptospiraceae bacterium]
MKNVLILGAGSGIGKALLDSLSKKKDTFVLGVSRSGEEYAGELQSGKNYRKDITLDYTFDFLKSLKSLDAVYITLGNGLFKPFEKITKEEWEAHLLLNLTAPFLALQNLIPYLKQSPSPFVCFLSSTAGKQGFPESSAYCASKHGIAGLAKALREEWKPKVRVFTVYPGAISTPIWEGRDGFSPEDMIRPEDFAKYLEGFLDLDPRINIEESIVLPPKGIL